MARSILSRKASTRGSARRSDREGHDRAPPGARHAHGRPGQSRLSTTRFGTPQKPEDLRGHNCVVLDQGAIVEVDVGGSLVTTNIQLMARAVVSGACIALGIESAAKRAIDRGEAVPLLRDYARPFPGWHVYYPGRPQLPLPLRAFIDFLLAHPAVA
jgi:DNA-binding transcriptional LysR family regulator